jgi:hypothetical protein
MIPALITACCCRARGYFRETVATAARCPLQAKGNFQIDAVAALSLPPAGAAAAQGTGWCWRRWYRRCWRERQQWHWHRRKRQWRPDMPNNSTSDTTDGSGTGGGGR